jgi:hypothetical protein
MDQPSPFIFLSHSGADSDAARNLKRRLLDSPDARTAGLKVWFDKDDLRPGGSWQPQIEQAIANATAFVVFVGSKGVMNWVEAEVRVALSRANADKGFLFIPALAAESAGSSALPPFAKLFQGVCDPLGDGEELAKLLKAVLQLDWDRSIELITEPFVGLRSMREEEADRFFGRDAEVKELVKKFGKHRIVAIVADSGTGKSSLAQAGFIPTFRGGALVDPLRDVSDDRFWHVVTMRPRSNPEEGLRLGVTEAAEKLGRSPDQRASLRRRVGIADASETAFTLQCDLPARTTSTLLIVDQFEELFTATPDPLVAPFLKLLLDLADSDRDFRILLTVRADYFDLLSDVKDSTGEAIRSADGRTLLERLNAEGGDTILRLKRVLDDGLSDIICKPLRLAGVSDDQSALVKAVQSDISDQPSDLPLLQVALKVAWQERKTTNRSMLEAYQSVGGVRRALANEAEKAREKLSAEDQSRLESIFVRLVRVRLVRRGYRAEATKRTAALDEFDDPRRDLLQRLGNAEHGRLVVVGQTSAEIAHEALITQWPWLRQVLTVDPLGMDRLDWLISKSREWGEAPTERKSDYLSTGAEREGFDKLAKEHPDWLSNNEREFIAGSNEAGLRLSYTPAVGLMRQAWNEHRGWAKLARDMQAGTPQWNLAAQLCLIGAAFFGAVASIAPNEWSAWMAGAATLAAAVGAFLGRQMVGAGDEAAWIQARATAEAIKSQCFRYAAGTYFGTDSEAANAFDLCITELRNLATTRGLACADDPVPASGDRREPAVPLTKDWYRTKRIDAQIDYYRNAQARNEASAQRLGWVAFASALAAVVFGALGTWAQAYAPWIGAMTTIVAVMIATYAPVGRFAANYAAMRANFEKILQQDVISQMRLSDLVQRTEDLLQSEDTV